MLYCHCRSKTVEWLPFCTQRVVDDFVSHLRIFRKALKNCQENGNNLISSDV